MMEYYSTSTVQERKLRLPVMLSGCSPLALAFLLGPLTGSLLLPFLQGGGSDDTELRYSTQYEERLDPFSSFSKRVRGPGCGAAWGDVPSVLVRDNCGCI